jgi:hypothetical protein
MWYKMWFSKKNDKKVSKKQYATYLSGVQLYLTKKVDGVTYVLLQLRKGG